MLSDGSATSYIAAAIVVVCLIFLGFLCRADPENTPNLRASEVQWPQGTPKGWDWMLVPPRYSGRYAVVLYAHGKADKLYAHGIDQPTARSIQTACIIVLAKYNEGEVA